MRLLLILLLSTSVCYSGEPVFKATGKYVEKTKVTIVSPLRIDYWTADWCSACRTNKPYAEAAAKEMGVVFNPINYDYNKSAAVQAKVSRLPTLVIVKDGYIIQRYVGGLSKSQVTQIIKQHSGKTTIKTKEVVKPVTRMSQREMIQLHNRLHGGGQWTWPGDLKRHLETIHNIKF